MRVPLVLVESRVGVMMVVMVVTVGVVIVVALEAVTVDAAVMAAVGDAIRRYDKKSDMHSVGWNT